MFNPALTIPDQKSPWAKLGKNSQRPGTAIPAIDSAGLNAPAYWNGIWWIFDAVNNAVTIVFAQQEPSKIGRNCLTIAMVNPAAPGWKSDVSRLWNPNRHAKKKPSSPSGCNVCVLVHLCAMRGRIKKSIRCKYSLCNLVVNYIRLTCHWWHHQNFKILK